MFLIVAHITGIYVIMIELMHLLMLVDYIV